MNIKKNKTALQKLMKKLRLVTILALAINLAFSASLFISKGWFSISDAKRADTDSAEIDEPPVLYILDNDAEDITQLSLSGLEIGVEKQIVFCVSSVFPVNSEDPGHKTSINLELAYTQNLGAHYDLYNAEIVSENDEGATPFYSQVGTTGYFKKSTLLSFTDITSAGNAKAYSNENYTLNNVQKKNIAVYKKYLTSSKNDNPNYELQFTTPTLNNTNGPLFDKSKCRFFILDITWDANISNMKELEKETDLVYILAKGGGTQ